MDEMNKLPEEQKNEKINKQENLTLESTEISESTTELSTYKAPQFKLPLIIGGAVAFVALISVIVAFIVTGGFHSHDFGEWSVTKNATCTEDGEQTRYCDCGEKQRETIPAGHKRETIPAKAATCTDPGSTKGSYCSICGIIIVAPSVVEPKHNFINSVCTVCGEGDTTDESILIMEAEYIALDDVPGMGISCENPGLCMIYGDGRDDQKQLWSNGYYVGYMYNENITLTFEFNSSAATTATVYFRLACEWIDLVLLSGENLDILVNGEHQYFNWSITSSDMDKAKFYDYKLTVDLVEGTNKIELDVLRGIGILVDYVKVEVSSSSIALSWEPHEDNPYRRDTEI